ncbi:ATP-dependent DNA ligase [Streptomyces sp. SD15]
MPLYERSIGPVAKWAHWPYTGDMGLRANAQPRAVRRMLATLAEDYFSNPGRCFERKLDGGRCKAFRDGDGDGTRLASRGGEHRTDTYPEVARALARQNCEEFVVDGKTVTLPGTRTSFVRLQQPMGIHDADKARRSTVAVTYYVFDPLHLDRHDLTSPPLRVRGAVHRALTLRAPLRFTHHRNAAGQVVRERPKEER